MPGNGVGDRIHNFFGQENLSQGQQQSQGVDRTWPTLSSNPWGGSQGQIGTPLISNLKNHNVQQSADSESGHGGQSAGVEHDLNFSQSSLRSEFSRYQSQSQQPALNGYMHGHQVFQARQNEANFMGVATESDGHNLTSRGFSVFHSQLGNGPELHQKNSGRMDFTESPVNYDFFGGQQQMNSQQPLMMQSLPRQQPGIRDQMLRQRFMLRQMQEIQRQQQFQQQEARQLNSVNQVSSFAEQASHSMAMINGIPVHDTFNYSWKPELMAANANWPQHGVSPFVQGSSGGVFFSPDQVQASHLSGMVPQQVDQSLHVVPISGTRVTPSQYSPIRMDKSTIEQIQGSSASLQGNQYTGFSDQVSMDVGALASRQGYQGKIMIGPADGQGLNCGINMENMQYLNPQPCSTLRQESSQRQEVACPSETSQNKTEMQVSPSQTVATLDPAEEKILFGSDDNVWGGFEKGTNMLDGTDVFAFPSVQSGSWSALMQSAVAETSSGTSDAGQHEEWSGLNFQINEPPVGNQLSPTLNEIGKQQSSWANRMQTPSSSTSISHNNIPFVKQPGVHERSESLQACSSPSFTHHFPGEQNKSFPQKSVADGSNIFGKLSHSLDAESHAKSISGSWTNQQSLPSYNTGGQQSSRQNGWNFVDSMSRSMSAAQKNMGKENSFQASQSTDQKSSMFGAAGSGTGIWKTDPVAKLGEVKSAIGSPRADTEDTNLNNVSTLPDSSAVTAGGQQHSMNNNMDIWKRVNSSVYPKGGDNTGKYQSQTDMSHQSFVSSGNNSLSNGAIESHEMQNSNAKSSTDIFLSGGKPKSSCHIGRKPSGRKFQYHPMGDLDVDAEPSNRTKQASHSQPMLQQVSEGFDRQSKFPSQVDKNSVEIEKDQCSSFHGDTKGLEGTLAKGMLPGSVPITSGPIDRAVHGNSTVMITPTSQNMLELFHKVDHSREHGNATQYGSSDHNQPSEMPEARISDGFVHLQQSMPYASQGFGLQLAPPSQLFPVQDNAFSSQSHSLKSNSMVSSQVSSDVGEKGHQWLASASSFLPLPASREASQGEFGNNVSGTSAQAGNNAQGNFSATFSSGFPFSRSNLQNQHMNEMGGHATVSQSVNASFGGFATRSKQMNEPFERSQASQSTTALVADISTKASHSNIAFSAEVSQPSDDKQKHAGEATQQFPVLEAAPAPPFNTISGMPQDGDSSKKPSAVGRSVSNQQHSFGAQPQHFKAPPNLFKSNLFSKNNSETAFSQSQRLEDQNEQTKGNVPSESGAYLLDSHGLAMKEQMAKGEPWQQVSEEKDPALTTVSASQGKELLIGPSLPSPSSTQREIEAFGRTLRPKNNLHQNYSFLNQMQSMKSREVDPSNRNLKRFKGPEGALDSPSVAIHAEQQIYGHGNMVREAATSHTSTLSGDSNMVTFSAKQAYDQDASAPSQDMLTFGQNNSQNISGGSNLASVRGELSQISPQMAPSWFDQYGTLKNGQILPIFDAQKMASMMSIELPLTIARPSDGLHGHDSVEQRTALAADASQLSAVQKSSTASLLQSENLSFPQLLSPDAANASLVVVEPKKRKSSTCEPVPWHKEVTHGLRKLQNISEVEVDWSRAANRLPEKVEDEIEIVEDGPPQIRSKRRLILTTQLMQLLLYPPPASVLFADANSDHQSVAHFIARSTLGDACSALSFTGSDTLALRSSGNILADKLKTSESIKDQFFSKVVEDLIGRAKLLENDLLRLDKRASVLDLRVECQDLEKFSVINRFAKFHGRGQSDGDTPANALKNSLQRYVIALPIPKNLPDRVQCLSL